MRTYTLGGLIRFFEMLARDYDRETPVKFKNTASGTRDDLMVYSSTGITGEGVFDFLLVTGEAEETQEE